MTMRRNAALAGPALVVLGCAIFLAVWGNTTVVSIVACAAVFVLTVVGCAWVLGEDAPPPQHARDGALPKRETLTATDDEMRVYWSGYMHDAEGNAYVDAFEYPNPPQYWLRAYRDESARDDTPAL